MLFHSVSLTDQRKFLVACKLGHPTEAQSFLEGDADINFQEINGLSALMYASRDGHLEVVKLLLESGAMVDLVEEKGWSALMFACQMGHYEVAKLLLDYGADSDQQSLEWDTPLSLAMQHKNSKLIALIEVGILGLYMSFVERKSSSYWSDL